MRAGDLNGLHDVYDDNGVLIMKDGERLLRKIDGDNVDIWKGKHGILSKTLVPGTKEKGTLYITDQRLVFIRTPDPWLYYKTYSTPFALPEGISGAMKARDLKSMGLKVFAEIPLQDVKSFKSHKKGKWMRLWLEDPDGTPIQVYIERLNKKDDKVLILEETLVKAGARNRQ